MFTKDAQNKESQKMWDPSILFNAFQSYQNSMKVISNDQNSRTDAIPSFLVAPEVNPIQSLILIPEMDSEVGSKFLRQTEMTKSPEIQEPIILLKNRLPSSLRSKKTPRVEFDVYEEFASDEENAKDGKYFESKEFELSALFVTPEYHIYLEEFASKDKEKSLKLRFFDFPDTKTNQLDLGRVFPLREFVRKVTFRNLSNKKYECKVCHLVFLSKGGIGGHMSKTHGRFSHKKVAK